MLEGPEETLRQTEHAQPALLIAGLAAHAKLKRDSPEVAARCRWAGRFLAWGRSLGGLPCRCLADIAAPLAS